MSDYDNRGECIQIWVWLALGFGFRILATRGGLKSFSRFGALPPNLDLYGGDYRIYAPVRQPRNCGCVGVSRLNKNAPQ